MISASRLAVHVIQWSKTLPDPDHFKHSVIISIIIHGSALAILNLVTYGLWIAIALCGNVAYQFLYKLTQFPISFGVVLPAIQKFPVTVGFVLISMACASCGGIALISALVIYFVLLSKMYEDYLEEFVFKTAAMITQKLFGKKVDEIPDSPENILLKSALASMQKKPANGGRTPKASTKNDDQSSEEKLNESEPSQEKSIDKKLHDNISSEKKDNAGESSVRSRKNGKKKRKEDKPAAPIDGEEFKASTSKMVKFDLNVQECENNTVAVAGPQESFEELYEQLDPEDVAIFSRMDEVDETLDEEARKEMAAKEAGEASTN